MDHDNDGDYSNDESGTDNVNPKGVKREDGKSGASAEGKGEKKGGINRVNRACNNCRRMKMRCVGAEDPPCKRCRNGGLECIMEKPGRGTSGGEAHVGEDRIRSLEGQVSAIQNTLVDLVSTLRAGMSSTVSNTSGHTPTNISGTTPDYAPTVGQPLSVQPQALHHIMNQSPTIHTMNMAPDSGFNRSVHGSQSPHHPMFSGSQPSFMPNQTPPYPLGNPSYHNHNGITAPARQVQPLPQRRPAQDDSSRRQSFPAQFPPPGNNWTIPSYALPERPEHQTKHMSLPPSRAGSVGPEDILGPEEIINPLGQMSSMAGLVEAAVERAREEQAKVSVQQSPLKRASSEIERPSLPEDAKQQNKKARFNSPQPPMTGQIVYEHQNLPPKPIMSGSRPGPMKPHIHNFSDVVTDGHVSEQEGRELMKVFYSGSSNFIPCMDPSTDTWDNLRIRSPWLITAIIFVGARVRDGGGPPSDVQRIARQHAEKIAAFSLFHSVGTRIEAVQSIILLAAFRDNGWLPGGHAVRMAVDMGINRSFMHLLRTGMGKGKTKEELEEERSLVVQSRTWLCLYLMEHQMAYGTGRPAIIREDETIHQCRRLLEHPMSIMSDARLVSTVELTALRSPLHIELTSAPDLPIAENTLKRLKQANADFDAWERYWDRILSDRFMKGKGDFYRESLVIQRQYAELFVNSQLLRGIREPADIIHMPDEKRILAIRAMRNAQRCLDICLHGENYRNGLKYAVHYTHVCAAFAASFLIRIARLFPGELNLRKTAKDVEELAMVLSEIPAGRYARSLRLILRKARRQKVIPAASRLPSPTKPSAALPPIPAPAPAPPGHTPTASTSAFSPSQLVNSSFYPTPSPGGGGPAVSVSPSSAILLNATQHIMNDSPSSTDMFEFDSLFAQETMEKAGIQLGEDNHLPLFLDGHSLGASANQMDMAPYVGLEQFFLPQEVDNRLTGPAGNGSAAGSASGSQAGGSSTSQNQPLDMWADGFAPSEGGWW
ncbi:hypothetical protein IAU60_002202 [Kwoniella sp. DSM 27419]